MSATDCTTCRHPALKHRGSTCDEFGPYSCNCHRYTGTMFPMRDGPPLPMENAQAVYKDYAAAFGTRQSLEELGRRGGFSYLELPLLAKYAEEARQRRGIVR